MFNWGAVINPLAASVVVVVAFKVAVAAALLWVMFPLVLILPVDVCVMFPVVASDPTVVPSRVVVPAPVCVIFPVLVNDVAVVP
jgi:hypothetical protein